MSVIFEGVDMQEACCVYKDGDVEYCRFYDICEQRDIYNTNYKPDGCPLKPLDKELIPIRDEVTALQHRCYSLTKGVMCGFCRCECQYKAETGDK